MKNPHTWYTVAIDYAGDEFSRAAFHSRDIAEISSKFDALCEAILSDDAPLVERSAEIIMYEQDTRFGSLLPMRKLEVQQDGKYRIGYLATPTDLKVKPFLVRKLNAIGVNDDHISARPTL